MKQKHCTLLITLLENYLDNVIELVGSTAYNVVPEAKDTKTLSHRHINLLLATSPKVVIEIKANLMTEIDLSKAASQALKYG